MIHESYDSPHSMDPLLTPGTAFLNSLLEPNNFYTSSDLSQGMVTPIEQDKFSQAFETHNNATSLSNLLKARPADPSPLSHHNYFSLDPTLNDPLPGLTNSSSSSSGKADSSESPEQEPQSLRSYGHLSPRSAARIERNTAQEWWATGNYEQEALAAQFNAELDERERNDSFMPSAEFESRPTTKQTTTTKAAAVPRKGRKRAKLTKQELDEKHQAFLERNRIAAGKCRTRKKKRVEGLEERFMAVKSANFGLKEAVRGLEAEIWSLKELLGRADSISNNAAGLTTMMPNTTTTTDDCLTNEEVEGMNGQLGSGSGTTTVDDVSKAELQEQVLSHDLEMEMDEGMGSTETIGKRKRDTDDD